MGNQFLKYILMSGVLLISMVLTGLMGQDVVQKMNALRRSDQDTAQWTMIQAEVEYLSYLYALEAARTAPPEDRADALEELRLRYDIYYSRIYNYRSSNLFEFSANSEKLDQSLNDLERHLEESVSIIDLPDDQLYQKIQILLEMSLNARQAVRDFSLLGVSSFLSASENRRNELANTLSGLGLTIAFMVVVLTFTVILLYRQYQNVHESHRQLELSSIRMQTIVDTSLDAIMVTDGNGFILDYNPAAKRIFGYEKSFVLGKHMFDLIVPPYHRKVHYEKLMHYFATGESMIIGKGRIEMQVMRKSGVVFPCEVSASIAQTASEKIVVCHFRDITQRNQTERELRDARDKAQEGERTRAEMLAIMSHEMRTPLNGVMGAVSLMAGTDITERQKQYLNAISTSASLLLHHVNDVLELARLDAKVGEAEKKPFNLKNLIYSLVDSQVPNARSNGNKIVLKDYPTDYEWVIGDQVRLQQILLNFIGNATKFTKDGSITLEAVPMEHKDMFEIRVIDTGMGISEENLNKIFDEFVAIDSSYGRQNEGTGLGLSITRRLAESLGGEVGATSELGAGSTFWVRLPLPQYNGPEPDQAIVNKPLDERFDRGSEVLRILVVEDNEVNRMVLTEMLKRLGHSVQTAADGASGVRYALKERFDLIFMDVSMPGMDGLEATIRIRQAYSGSHDAQICAITAHSAREDLERMTRVGMDVVLTKPFTQDQLFEILANAHPSLHVPKYDGFRGEALDDVILNLGHKRTSEFVHEYHEDMTQLVSNLPLSDLPDKATINEIHRLAGSSAVLGAIDLTEALKELEANCIAGDHDSYTDLVQDLEELLRLTKSAQFRHLSRQA